MIAVLLVAYSFVKVRHLALKDNPRVILTTDLREDNFGDEFHPQDGGFSISFGLDPGVTVDPSYVYFEASAVDILPTGQYYDDGRVVTMKRKTPLPISLCGFNLFNHTEPEEIELYGIDSNYCINQNNLTVRGSYYSDFFSYIEIKLYKCQNSTTPNSPIC